jgi:GNAT superfamily N-acetyltransferase
VDPAYILQILDRERQRVPGFGTHLEVMPNVVRAVGVAWNGIAFARFSTAEAETIIDQEIAHWNSVDRAFEWKVYSHDQPPDLISRLRKRRFKIGREEALMILDIEEIPETLSVMPSKAIKVEKVRDESRIADFLLVEQAIWNRTRLTHEQLASSLSDTLERDVGFLAYQDEKPVGFARLTASLDSAFAGLWGGGVLENFRGKGVYRALLAARIAEAKTRPGVRFLRVDALPTSQPILEKYSFVRVAKTWPCNWPAN